MLYGSAQRNLRQLIGSLRTVGKSAADHSETLANWPFVTISRQAGSGGILFGRLLAQRLNDSYTSHEEARHPWTCLDRELVERIAADHHLSADLIYSLEKSSHTWITEFFDGLSHADRGTPSEVGVFRRIVQTVRALARAGHVVLVGLGSVFITRDIPGGIHVRIVAPFEWRVENLARNDKLTAKAARERVEQLDNDRHVFIQRFFPGKSLVAENFHVTLNASMLTDEQMADSVAAIFTPAFSAAGHS